MREIGWEPRTMYRQAPCQPRLILELAASMASICWRRSCNRKRRCWVSRPRGALRNYSGGALTRRSPARPVCRARFHGDHGFDHSPSAQTDDIGEDRVKRMLASSSVFRSHWDVTASLERELLCWFAAECTTPGLSIQHEAPPDKPAAHQVGEPSGVVHVGFEAPHVLDVGRVWMTLQDLSQADLLTAAIIPPGDLHRTRRNLLQKAAMIGLALPVVESVIAQSAKAHASDPKSNWDHRDHRRWRDRDERWDWRRDH